MIKNRSAFMAKLKRRLGVLPIENAQRACYKAANLVRNEAVQSIARGTKTGEAVRKYNPSRTHRQSAPGEPPASDTGFLVSNISIAVDVEGTGRAKAVVGKIISAAPYSAYLEFGTSNMAARPFMQPALDKNGEKIKRIFMKEGMLD